MENGNAGPLREKILFDDGWLFHRGEIETARPALKGPIYNAAKTVRALWGPAAPGYNDSTSDHRPDTEVQSDRWDPVDLPHDYVIEGAFDPRENNTLGYLKYEKAWYRRHITPDEADRDRQLSLYFEGITGESEIWLNGIPLYKNGSGYTSFEVDITDFVRFDADNVIAVHVDLSRHEGWWYEGGGIYRHVWLIKTAPIRVDLWGVHIVPHCLAGETWRVDAEICVKNASDADAAVEVRTALLDPAGQPVTGARDSLTVPAGDEAAAKTALEVQAPALWQVGKGVLYTLRTTVLTDGEPVDCVTDRFGFREVRCDPEKGLFVNGEPVKIRGLCGHYDCGLFGKAVPDNIFRYKVRLMREMGANGWRTSHYPHAEALMDALDEAGMIVLDEVRWFTSSKEGLEQLDMLMKRDRNRPSVFFWSIGNEEALFTDERGRRIARHMVRRARQLDPTRPVTAACNRPDRTTIYGDLDLVGINYGLDSYDAVHAQFPALPVLSTECCATGTSRGWYEAESPEMKYRPAYDRDTNDHFLARERTWKFLMAREWVMGGYQWDGFEHRGETVWPLLCSQSGAIDLFLQKKDAFWQNRSHWTKEPMLHLMPHWNLAGHEGERVRVRAYTNLDEAELFVNGESQGRVRVEPFGHAEWEPVYAPGRIECVGYRNGEAVCRAAHETTGQPVRLRLIPENADDLRANGRDAAIFTCVALDDVGREVPDAAPTVTFWDNGVGRIIATGSDDADHVPLASTVRRMYMGRITVAVRCPAEPGTMKLYAKAPGLAACRAEVDVR